MPFCQVIVDINHTDVDHVFTYRVPAGLDVCPGMRVHVPFGPRKLEGVVVEMAADCDLPPERVKDICDTLEKGVWEPLASKINSLSSACEAACAILSVDQTVKNPKSQQAQLEAQPKLNMGGMKGQPMNLNGMKVLKGRGGK